MRTIANINTELSRFVSIKFLVSLVTAIVIVVGFSFVKMDFLVSWFLLTLILNFIPTIGSIIVGALSIAFAFIKFYPTPGPIIAVIAIMVSTQMIIGNVLDPLLLGDRLNLSPLVIFSFLLYWGWVWGASGMLLAVPLAVALRVILTEFSKTSANAHFLSRLMGNKRSVYREYAEMCAKENPERGT